MQEKLALALKADSPIQAAGEVASAAGFSLSDAELAALATGRLLTDAELDGVAGGSKEMFAEAYSVTRRRDIERD